MSTASSRVTVDPTSAPAPFSHVPQGRVSTPPPRLPSPRKLNANRANAKKSTGPKSPQGKKKVSRNATTHGIHCQHLVLPGEDVNLFHSFRTSYLLDLHPRSSTELLLVDRIVNASWKLRRLQSAEYHLHLTEIADLHDNLQEAHEHYQQTKQDHDDYLATCPDDKDTPKLPSPPPILDNNTPPPPGITLARMLSKNDDRSLDRLHQHEQRLERSIHRSLKELRDLRKSRTLPDEDLPLHPFLDNHTYANLFPHHPREQFEQFKPTEEDDLPPSPSAESQNEQIKPTTDHSPLVASATSNPAQSPNSQIQQPNPCPPSQVTNQNSQIHDFSSVSFARAQETSGIRWDVPLLAPLCDGGKTNDLTRARPPG